MCCAGMIGGDRRSLVMIGHDGIERCEVLDALRRRWPDVVVKDLAQEEPAWSMLPCRSRTMPQGH
jgi:hypothetical protein